MSSPVLWYYCALEFVAYFDLSLMKNEPFRTSKECLQSHRFVCLCFIMNGIYFAVCDDLILTNARVRQHAHTALA